MSVDLKRKVTHDEPCKGTEPDRIGRLFFAWVCNSATKSRSSAKHSKIKMKQSCYLHLCDASTRLGVLRLGSSDFRFVVCRLVAWRFVT
jgi:hypothetical protein